jgi:signal peptidase
MIRKLTNDIDKVGFAATLLIVLAATPIVVFLVPQFMGLDAYVVSSGSMEPTMPTGSIVYNKPVLPSTIEVSDVITFVPNRSAENPEKVTHRVVEINEVNDTRIFRTRGDANPEPDEWNLTEENILGKKQFSIPYIGYALTMLASPIALILLLIIPSAILIRRHIQTLLEELDEEEEENLYKYSQIF